MKKLKKYCGVIIPAITPLTLAYKLDRVAVERIFNLFYQHQASPFILGTTGESSSLPFDMKKEFVKVAAANKKAGTQLYAGISSNVIGESVELAKICADHGVDAVAANLPSYYLLTEAQMKKYFETLADSIPLPLVIYNIPATTHMSIPVQLIEALSYHPNIIGVKDSERNEERLRQSIQLWKDREDFSHFLGWAARSAHALTEGSDGLIPSTGNLVPEIYSAMWKAVMEGDRQTAFGLQQQSDEYGNIYQAGKTLGESLWALKVLMHKKELCEPILMPPLQPGTAEEERLLIQSLNELNKDIAL